MGARAPLAQPERMKKARKRDRRADAQSLGSGCSLNPHHVNRGTDAEGMEVMLREPHRVVTSAVHYLDSLQRAVKDRLDANSPLGPAEELKHACLHLRLLWP